MTTEEFIRLYREEDVRQLALQGKRYPEVEKVYALEQIAGWQMARRKLPSWTKVEGIVYPPHLSMEQCSSEATARYKASVVVRLMGLTTPAPPSKGEEYKNDISPKGREEEFSFVDLTGGFGVDFISIAQGIAHKQVPITHHPRLIYVERQPQLCAISSGNFKRLEVHAEVVNTEAETFLHEMEPVSLILIDPARRNEHGGRTYDIADCTPNVLELMSELSEKCDWLMLKLSPMLDWRKAVKDIEKAGDGQIRVLEVHIVSVENECKELVLVVKTGVECDGLSVFCVVLDEEGNVVSGEELKRPTLTVPKGEDENREERTELYLYEPNASVMKAGFFDEIGQKYGMKEVGKNSHLYVSDSFVTDFPGRKFHILSVSSMNKNDLKRLLTGIERANITVRNFPLKVEELRKRLKLKDGGDLYLFATTRGEREHVLFLTRKAIV